MDVKTKLADCVDLESVVYQRNDKERQDRAIVLYSKSTGFHFNPKMVKLLRMENWGQVLVGIDQKSNIIVLKECDVEEFGWVKVKRIAPDKSASEKSRERSAKCRTISINHLVKNLSYTMPKHFRAERDGLMVFLKAVKNTNETEL